MRKIIYADEVDFKKIKFHGEAYPISSLAGNTEWYQKAMYKGKEYYAIFDFAEIIDKIEESGELDFSEKYF